MLRHGYDVTITDMSKIEAKEELEALGMSVWENGHPDTLKNEEWAFVVKNPGIKYTVPFVKYFVDHKIKILTEVEIGYRYAKKIPLWSCNWHQWKNNDYDDAV